MKKIYFSLITIAILLFTACTNNDVPGNEAVETGTLTATISFEGKSAVDGRSTRAVGSNAIPTVSWENVEQVQLFLYGTDGRVAFSRTVIPTASNQTFTWANVPVGSYRLALLANVKSSSDNMATLIGTAPTEFTDANVIGQVFNTDLKIDLKTIPLPTNMGPSIPPHDWDVATTGKVGYAAPSEVFTAFKDITIAAGAVTTVPATELVLRREIAMMRARFNIKQMPDQPVADKARFGNVSDFIVIQRLPVGFELPVGGVLPAEPANQLTRGGSIVNLASDDKRVMIGETGADTYKTANPTSGYSPTTILGGDFTLWNDIHVLPNASKSEIESNNLTKGSNLPEALNSRKYFIIISALVDKDYVYADGSIAQADNSLVYWFGTIDGAFTKNVIREVNMTLTTEGYPDIPVGPGEFGGLEINVGIPENWDSEIVSSDIEA